MLMARWVVALLLVSGVLLLVMSLFTGNLRHRRWGVRLIQWTIVAGLVFFGVLILERVTTMF